MKRWSRIIISTLILYFCTLTGCTSSTTEFIDDFSDPASGWGAASHETYVRGYQQGEYLIQIDVPQWFVWATAGKTYDDADIKVDVRFAGQSDNHWGVICRYKDEVFYYFAISSDGYYGIFKHVPGGDLMPLTGNDMLFSPLIRLEGANNQLHALCQAESLSLYVNGQMLAEIVDGDLTKGDVGLAAGTVKSGGTSVWFDDFEVGNP